MHHRFTLLLIVGILVSCTTAVPTTLPAITLSPTTTESPTPIRSARPTSMQQPAHTLTPSPPKDWPTRLLSISPNGDPDIGSQAQLSDDGRYAVYESGFNIYLRDLDEDTTILVTVSPNGAAARGWSFAPSISADGSTVAFFSLAGNLLDRSQRVCPAEATCEGGALYLYDIASSTLTWIPVGTAEHILGDTALSADGRYVAFASPWAFFREGVYLYDRTTDALTTIVEGDIASQDSPIRNGGMAVDISADGRFVAFTSADDDIVPGDHKGVSDVFVFDRDTNRIQRISTPYNDIESDQPSGFQWIPATDGAFERGLSISADGRYVVFM